MAVEFLGRELTVQRVLDAYAATGLKPAAGSFTRGKRVKCGCALSAVAIAEGAATFETVSDKLAFFEIECPLGFTSGFDGWDNSDPNEAYELGQACRKAVGL